MNPGLIPHIYGPEAFAAQFSVSRETRARLETYARLLTQWQKSINLVAPSTLGDVWHRHFADSAQIFALAPPVAERWLDLGSGAGFPGLVVAILAAEFRPSLKVKLLESDSRKAAFLREVARQTGVAVDILCARIELPTTQLKVGKADVVSARALAPLDRLLQWSAPYFAGHSVGLYLKGRGVEGEVAEAESRASFGVQLLPSLTDPEGRIAAVRDLSLRVEGSNP